MLGFLRSAVYAIGIAPVFVCAQHNVITMDTAGINCSFRGAAVLNDKIAWVSGSKGMVGKTTDGGLNWNFIKVLQEDDADLRDIEALDNNTALVLNVTHPARILRTTNGGESWVNVYTASTHSIFLDGFAFWDKNRGIAYGDPVNGAFYLLQTSDGGRTWKELPSDQCPKALADEVGFAASGTGIRAFKGGSVWFASGGPASNIYYSSDYGTTWAKYPTPVLSGGSSKGINSIAFHDRHNGIAVGGDFTLAEFNEDVYAWTHDGGVTWHHPKHPHHAPNGYRSCVEYLSSLSLLATGLNGTDISHDGGKTWHSIDTGAFHVIAKAKNGKWVLLAGQNGRIGRLVHH